MLEQHAKNEAVNEKFVPESRASMDATGDEEDRCNSTNFRMRRRQHLLRRCKSVSRVEDIVTEDEKRRRAQPDKPIHKPRDSIFSLSSGFQNFEGMITWAFLLLTIGGIRLFLENLNKYGIRVNPLAWGSTLYGCHFSILWLLLYANVPVIMALIFEKMITRNLVNPVVCMGLHVCNISHVLLIPVVVIYTKYDHVGPAMGTVVCFLYTVLFFKLWSYAQVNHWCRLPAHDVLHRRGGFTSYYCINAMVSSVTDTHENDKNGEVHHKSHLGGGNGYSVTNFRPIAKCLRRTRTLSRVETEGDGKTSCENIVQYPDNLTLRDIYYFWFAPTLCYELNFPRSSRIRKTFLLRRALEVVLGTNIVLALIQQWIIPAVVNSLIPFSNMNLGLATERLLKIAIPNHLLWLTVFYLLFHSTLNTVAEVLQFADRGFYLDWWNAKNLMIFWKTWNLPVHRWCLRHMYKPILGCFKGNGGSIKMKAMTCVFLVSALSHEYLISVPLRIFKAYAFVGMMLQIPLIFVSETVEKNWGPRAGNLIVWLSLIIGQPLAVLMYYHDFVVEHYGQDDFESFGKL